MKNKLHSRLLISSLMLINFTQITFASVDDELIEPSVSTDITQTTDVTQDVTEQDAQESNTVNDTVSTTPEPGEPSMSADITQTADVAEQPEFAPEPTQTVAPTDAQVVEPVVPINPEQKPEEEIADEASLSSDQLGFEFSVDSKESTVPASSAPEPMQSDSINTNMNTNMSSGTEIFNTRATDPGTPEADISNMDDIDEDVMDVS